LWCSSEELKLEPCQKQRTAKEAQMSAQTCPGNFEQNALPHLNSLYNLARWLTRSDQDAEDIVQETYLRALKSYHRFRGGDARPWLLKIVRNVYYTLLQNKSARQFIDFDDDLITGDPCLPNPEEILIQASCGVMVRKALETLPTRSREMLTLRELERMSYKEISIVMEVPLGTVMSTLSRARARFRQSVTDLTTEGSQPPLEYFCHSPGKGSDSPA
jgi:RNA polymerase sigma-70 factor (ECF subfamily)